MIIGGPHIGTKLKWENVIIDNLARNTPKYFILASDGFPDVFVRESVNVASSATISPLPPDGGHDSM